MLTTYSTVDEADIEASGVDADVVSVVVVVDVATD